MKLPLSWLSDYTDMTGITPKEYDAKLTMSGSKVEEVYYLGAEIENVVTGKILSVVDHPDSDHLTSATASRYRSLPARPTLLPSPLARSARSQSISPPCPAA